MVWSWGKSWLEAGQELIGVVCIEDVGELIRCSFSQDDLFRCNGVYRRGAASAAPRVHGSNVLDAVIEFD